MIQGFRWRWLELPNALDVGGALARPRRYEKQPTCGLRRLWGGFDFGRAAHLWGGVDAFDYCPPTDHRRVGGYSLVLLACLRRTGSISQDNGRGGNYGVAMVADRGDVIPHY